MANILKQIQVGDTTYNIEPVTAYLPLTGGTINAGGSKAPLILKGGASNWNEGLRIIPAGNWSTIMLGGNDIAETEGTSANSWSIHNNNGKFYISKNGSDYASTKLSNTDGTWRVNDNDIIHSGNIGSQNVNYANSAGLVEWGNVNNKPITITQRNNDSPISGAYAWGTYVTMRNANNWFEIYAPHMGTSSDRVYMQTGWDNDRQGWKAIAWTSDIPTSLPANGGNADTVDGKHSSDFCLSNSNITNLPINGGIYWNSYVESSSDGSDAASITVIRDGNGSGGTVLQIKQANDANDIVNVVAGDLKLNGTSVSTNGHTHTKSQISDFSHTHSKSEVGLGNVDNTADANKNVNYANSANSANYFNYGRGVTLANSSSFRNNFCKDIFGEENNNNYHLVELRTQSQAPSCLFGDYSSGIAWKGSDTYGSLMVRYSTSEIRVSGGNGANTNPNWTVDLVHSGNIGSQSVNYANGAGTADYAASSHLLRTYNADNGSHGADYYLKCKHNVDGNGRFKLQIVRSDGSVTHSTSVDFATSAGSVAWGNIGGKPSTFPTTVDSSLNSSSSNPVQNSTIYSAFSGTVGFDHDKYAYGETGSWRLLEYHATGNSLDIRYGKININAQEKTYSVSFGENKSFGNNTYAIVCGIYRDNRNSWFWSPLITKKSPTGFNVYVRGNTGSDNSGTLMYIAIRSN